jgi:hypothetical protein
MYFICVYIHISYIYIYVYIILYTYIERYIHISYIYIWCIDWWIHLQASCPGASLPWNSRLNDLVGLAEISPGIVIALIYRSILLYITILLYRNRSRYLYYYIVNIRCNIYIYIFAVSISRIVKY